LISIGSKQDQEQEQEQEADLDLRLFSEEHSRFSEFSGSAEPARWPGTNLRGFYFFLNPPFFSSAQNEVENRGHSQ
jgi:hypothetical protein